MIDRTVAGELPEVAKLWRPIRALIILALSTALWAAILVPVIFR